MKYAVLSILFLVLITAQAEVDRQAIVWDDQNEMPSGWLEGNPLNILYAMTCQANPALDHTGKPHKHGDVLQLIKDGGNGMQDPPNADGSPGGDDSLAYGNFNMIVLLGLEGTGDLSGRTGQFYARKYFAPFEPNRTYYLRLWEGKDPATAPYYQDTVEYVTGDDRGGAMIRLVSGFPHEVDWSFGPSIPRPTTAKGNSQSSEKK
jgi:hypothetical protein